MEGVIFNTVVTTISQRFLIRFLYSCRSLLRDILTMASHPSMTVDLEQTFRSGMGWVNNSSTPWTGESFELLWVCLAIHRHLGYVSVSNI
jgi:hypothetical protein